MKKSSVIIICVLIFAIAVCVALAISSYKSLLPGGLGLKSKEPLTVVDYSGYYTTDTSMAYTVESGDSSVQDALSFEPSSDYVKPVGRTVFYNGARWMSMSGSGIEFDCDAEAVEITLLSENNSYVSYNHKPRIAVFANDCLIFDGCLESDETTVHADLSSFDGKATVSVIKLSESMHSSCGIGEIKAFGTKNIKPSAQRSLKLEFIGDSITTGYGIDEHNKYRGFSTRTQNFAKTYAYLTSKRLKADYSAVAFSGYGVASGFTANGRKTEDVIFRYLDKAITDKSTDDGMMNDEWNYTEYIPDAVIINLGTNDATYCTTAARRAEFVSEYKRLLASVKSKYPDAYVLCILGDMNNSLFSSIETAVDEYKAENGDSKIFSATVDFKMGENEIVIDGHPGAQSNLIAAEDLSEKIYSMITENVVTDEN